MADERRIWAKTNYFKPQPFDSARFFTNDKIFNNWHEII